MLRTPTAIAITALLGCLGLSSLRAENTTLAVFGSPARESEMYELLLVPKPIEQFVGLLG